jgi:hypothetical protein
MNPVNTVAKAANHRIIVGSTLSLSANPPRTPAKTRLVDERQRRGWTPVDRGTLAGWLERGITLIGTRVRYGQLQLNGRELSDAQMSVESLRRRDSIIGLRSTGSGLIGSEVSQGVVN